MAKFLDENGVKKLWSRIQEYVYECCCSKGGGDVGYECQDGYETFWKDSVQTTRGSGDWSQRTVRDGTIIDAEKIRVIFQGTAYDLGRRIAQTSSYTYYEYGEFTSEGEPILTNLPIAIQSRRIRTDNVLKANSSGMLRADLREETVIYTRKSGIYNIEIQTPGTVVETTECFQKAVKSVGDSGYDCTTSFVEVFSSSGATTAQEVASDPCMTKLKYNGFVHADEIKVVFNGNEYICPKISTSDSYANYGSDKFTDYPFALVFSTTDGNYIYTKDPIDFTIEVSASSTFASVTPCFKVAVEAASIPLEVRLSASLNDASCEGKVYAETQLTYDQIYEAIISGRNVFFFDPKLGALMVTMINPSARKVGVYAKVGGSVQLFEFSEFGNGRMKYPTCTM